MELPKRPRDDVYLPDGAFRAAIDDLASRSGAHDLRIAIVYAFDFRTRMLPYWYADKRMAPCSVRTLADVLSASGFKHVRVVLQQWTPNFRPSEAVLDGKPIDILMTSAMQVHGEPSYDLIRDAHRLGERRPLILSGGPKAIYEPCDYFNIGSGPGVGADCVVTGEAYVLLQLLHCILDHRQAGDSALHAFRKARAAGSLNQVPGLVYVPDGAPLDRPYAVNTGVQRLLGDLDEMPMPDAGYRLLEPPHRKRTLAPKPCPPRRVGKLSLIASLIATHGCKFNCSFCPIPAANQRTWRHKSPARMAAEIKHIYENFGIREFFGTDDNFFNNRQTVIDLMTALANTTTNGAPLAERIRFYTEATQFDVHKNLDILPLCRRGGLRAIWFGIEDITAELINKGQNEGKTAELFARLLDIGIEPMAMMIHSDNQPLRSAPGDLSGLLNQAKYLFKKGAISYQCTYLGPAVGTRDFETSAKARVLYKSVAGQMVPQAYFDGNHVVASRNPRPWERQVNILRAYWCFYNPLNTLRVLASLGRGQTAGKRLLFQIIGQIGLLMTAPKLLTWARKLRRGPIVIWDGLQQAPVPMVSASTNQEMYWGIEYLPADSSRLPAGSPAREAAPATPGRSMRIPLPVGSEKSAERVHASASPLRIA